jgi:ubiquinone biosynthesis protein
MLKSAFAAARDRQRLQQIVGVLIAYGVTNVVDKLGLRAVAPLARWRRPSVDVTRLSQPERVRRAIEALGPTFIKLGQILASRTDLLPAGLDGRTRASCTARSSRCPWEQMAPQLESALGRPRPRRCSPSSTATLSRPPRSRRSTGRAWPAARM